MSGALIEMRKITRIYRMGEQDVPVLRGVSLDVQRGEFVMLVGSSGSGKSTLLNTLGCLDRPNGGTYLLDGENVTTMNRDQRALLRGRKIGFVFQSFNLLSRTSALENVELPMMYIASVPAREREKRAREALERVGLSDRVDHHPGQLSGGQQQRVAIARAIVTRPPVLLADEPTGNLDTKSGAEILNLLRELNREGMTLVMVTHDATIADTGSRKVTLRDGEIVEDTRAEATT